MSFHRFRFVLPALLLAGIVCAPPAPAQANFLKKMKKKVDDVRGKTDAATAKVTQPIADAQQKVLAPVNQAQQVVTNAQNQALAPVQDLQNAVTNAQNQALAPIRNAQNALNNAQNQVLAPIENAQQNAQNAVANAQNQALAPVTDAQNALNKAKNQALSPITNLQSTANIAKNAALAPVNSARQMPGVGKSQLGQMLSQLTRAERLTDGIFRQDAGLRAFKLDSLVSGDGKKLRLTGSVKSAAQRNRAAQLAARNFSGSILNEIRIAPTASKVNLKSKIRGLVR